MAQLPPSSKISTPQIINASETISNGTICVENYHAILETVKSSIRQSLKGKGERTLVLNDEAHHVTSESGATVRRWKEFLLDPDYGFKMVVGVSGTCYVGDDYFSDVIHRYSLRQAIEENFVKNVEYVDELPDAAEKQDEKWQLIHKRHMDWKRRLAKRDIRPLTIVVTKGIADAERVAGRAARDYAARGVPIFPCNPKNKSPLIKGGFKNATTEIKTVAGWWKKWPDAFIGMPTGAASGVAVLDLDVKNGKNGLEAVPDWRTRSAVIAKTQSGGVHIYFANDDRVRSQSDQIAPGVDTRGNGGYVIVPPSAGYSFFKGDLSDRSALPPWPDDIRPKEKQREEPAQPPPDETAGTTDYERAKIAAALAVVPSDDYQIWFEVGCALHHALGNDGHELFEQWSAKSAKYDKQECSRQWKACGAVEKITLGTLFHHADQAAPNWREEFEAKHGKPLILSSAEFIAGFTPPDYLIDGVAQRGFLYSMTAPTGTGKTAIALRISAHVACGLPLTGREIVQGKVLYFAGENPDDIRTRWIKLCEEMKLSPDSTDVFFVAGPLPISKMLARLKSEAQVHGPFALVIVDTLAAYYEGDEENSNTQMARNARMMRSLAQAAGGPTVFVTCHPTKSPNLENLLPRGGGAFLAEVDGNLVCLKQDGGVVDLHWQAKFRGPDFSPMPFKIEPGTSELLRDRKGRPIWTVTARPLSMQERGSLENTGRLRQGQLLAVMRGRPGLSLADLARALGWTYENGAPNKGLVKRTMDELAARGLVKKDNEQHWTLTNAGKKYQAADDDVM